MDLLLILLYVALCYTIFKIFRIPVNQWTLATAALGGIVGLSLLLLTMNYNHPFSSNARIYFTVTPVLPGVAGRVVEVPAVSDQPVKAGDILFRLDPAPYEYSVQQKRASLAEANQNFKSLKASLDEATASASRAKAQLQLAQQDYERQSQLVAKNVASRATLDTSTRNLEAATQLTAGATAAEDRARLNYGSSIDGVNTTVARIQAELDQAEYNLAQTVVRAPTDGFATQVTLRPGLYVVPAPLRPAMAFINTDEKSKALGAAFQQNTLQRVMAGDDAEIAFDAVPGRVFKGKVRMVLDAIAAGQFPATGTLQDFGARVEGGRALAIIDILEDTSAFQIPLGASAEVAIYTEHFHHLSMLRKVLLRMRSWQNYIYTEGH